VSNPRFEIRRGLVTDASALAAFAANVFTQAFGAENRPEDLQAHLQSAYGTSQQTNELADPDVVTLLAYEQTKLVGYAQVCRGAAPACVTQPAPMTLLRFYLDKSAHGSGLAQQLMTVAFDGARELEGQHLWLSTRDRNQRAIAFYKKIGFMDVGTTDFYVGTDKQTDRVLVASLAI